MALFQEETTEPSEEVDKVVDATPMSAGDPIAGAAAASVLYAWYKFYVNGDRQGGIFVGLWAPSLLAAANSPQQKDIVRKFRPGLASF